MKNVFQKFIPEKHEFHNHLFLKSMLEFILALLPLTYF